MRRETPDLSGYNRIMRLMKAFLPILAVGLLALGSCKQIDPHKGYTSRNLHQPDIKTVCVKMFESQSFRRGTEFELTRALAQRIEMHTPYKVVADERKADTVLYGTLVNISERTVAQQRDIGRPMDNQMNMAIDVTWKDLRNGVLLLDNQRIRVSSQYWVLMAAGRDSAARNAANEAAVRIVEAMEQPW